jgi:2-isopropylmalate synthase
MDAECQATRQHLTRKRAPDALPAAIASALRTPTRTEPSDVTDLSPRTGQPTRTVTIFDTTLRDGEQAPGNGMSAAEKRDMAMRLEALGVDVIEVGFPASSVNEFLAAQMVRQALTSATIATFSRCNEADIVRAVEAAGVTRHQVQLLATASDLHLTHKRGISRLDCFREVASAVRFAASLGVTNISVGLEDASRGTHGLLHALVECCVESGATTVVMADTSGCQLPAEYGDLVAAARSWVPDNVTLSVHCHDDMGLALANALAGIQAGADQVQTTLGGVGERSGNTALEELAAALTYKGEQLGVRARIDTKGLYQAYLSLKS